MDHNPRHAAILAALAAVCAVLFSSAAVVYGSQGNAMLLLIYSVAAFLQWVLFGIHAYRSFSRG